jgi:hypothetical protein
LPVFFFLADGLSSSSLPFLRFLALLIALGGEDLIIAEEKGFGRQNKGEDALFEDRIPSRTGIDRLLADVLEVTL